MICSLVSFRNLIYKMSKKLFHEQRPFRQMGPQQWISTLIFLLEFNFPYIVYFMYKSDHSNARSYLFTNFHHYDIFLSIIYHLRKEVDYLVILVLYLYNLFYFAVEYITYSLDVTRDSSAPWRRCWWELAVLHSGDLLRSCQLVDKKLKRVQLKRKEAVERKLEAKLSLLPVRVRKTLVSWCSSAKGAYLMDGVDWPRLPELPTFPCLSRDLRRRLLRSLAAADILSYWIQWVTALIYWSVVAGILLTYPGWSGHPWPAFGFFTLQISAGFYVLLSTARYSLFFTTLAIILTTTIPSYLDEEGR